MPVDRGNGGIDDNAEKVEEKHAADRRPPPDRPGSEPQGLSRADSRARAAAVSESA